jgi:hypothetical protein
MITGHADISRGVTLYKQNQSLEVLMARDGMLFACPRRKLTRHALTM